MNRLEEKPLFDKVIVITRPKEQAEELAELLRSHGAKIVFFPTIEIAPTEQIQDLDRAIGKIKTYQWIIFTSVNGVKFFFKRFKERGKDIKDLKKLGICSIGPATAGAIKERGIQVDLMPESFIAEGVVSAFQDMEISGLRILLPRAEIARDVIPEGLAKLGAQVDVVTIYSAVSSGLHKSQLEGFIENGDIDVITFTSPSTLKNFMKIMGEDFILPSNIRVACIGPVTAEAAENAGLKTDIVGEPYTISGLVKGLIDYFKNV